MDMVSVGQKTSDQFQKCPLTLLEPTRGVFSCYNMSTHDRPMIQLRPHQQRALDAMLKHSKGQLVMPTGAGKTLTMIFNAIEQMKTSSESMHFVVVAPRILLASQLCSEFLEHIDNAHIIHVHSGETDHFSTTKTAMIHAWHHAVDGHRITFTTYNSLQKVVDSGVHINTIYFDEAHNSVKKSFYTPTEMLSSKADRCYFFTATPKHSAAWNKPGMNNAQVYGNVIINVPAPELIENGSIIPPVVNAVNINMERDKEFGAERDCMTLLDTIINGDNMQKVLVAAPNTKVLMRMLAETDFMPEIQSYGYDVLWITSKHGAFINNEKVTREEFFNVLSQYGRDPEKKFVILHYSILSEGINCPGLTACVMMRQMDVIQMCQTIGRVIRLHPEDASNIRSGKVAAGDLDNYTKSFGLIHVPVYSNTGIATARRLQAVVDTVFTEGQPCIATIQK